MLRDFGCEAAESKAAGCLSLLKKLLVRFEQGKDDWKIGKSTNTLSLVVQDRSRNRDGEKNYGGGQSFIEIYDKIILALSKGRWVLAFKTEIEEHYFSNSGNRLSRADVARVSTIEDQRKLVWTTDRSRPIDPFLYWGDADKAKRLTVVRHFSSAEKTVLKKLVSKIRADLKKAESQNWEDLLDAKKEEE